ncbi:class I SAM-dependent methyltransferase [Methylocapsa palsarum]|uniref:Ubiquinone/menaquinone biosynthesis C-methylase UbiE n=1 Tax=Methylocapsa palsarum TaxID=1612308 RepID=A0A1I3XFL2_9HYPH|nr:class I SAM-dependent methyltransferase [Methylocapsa palsarum]SFK18272.1 Ubiquinone/menaquinone biosynthesis C-methylase UbiE [Methylocapsa palsarum]
MTSSLSRFATRAAYGARQLPRIAWYLGHGIAMSRAAQRQREQDRESARPRPHTDGPTPDRKRFLADLGALWRQDLANVEAGIYPVPADHDGSFAALIERSRLFFEDLPVVHRRRENGEHSEVLTEENRGKRPRYYLQNFHFQSGGWMTEDSAKRYDTQVEVLFNGAANAIRRQALPFLSEAFKGRDQRQLRLLDAGCGTGRFLDFVKQAWPRLRVTGLDLSEPYLDEARRHLARWPRAGLIVGNMELIPLPDESQDAVTSIFVFHELPPKVRRTVLREFARVLKPGGRLVLVDSLQCGDEPDYDGLLDLFPQSFHEPYYKSYIGEDFTTLCNECGLTNAGTTKAFVSKVMAFDKPARPETQGAG